MVVMATCFTCSSTPSPKSNFEFDFGFISPAPKPPRVMFSPFTGDWVRSVVYCFRCCKPRCIYAQKQFSTREKILLEEITANNVFMRLTATTAYTSTWRTNLHENLSFL